MLPNLIIIGAAKCGTTALYHYLSHHPEVFMARQKELRFFNDENWGRGTAWYESWFADATTRVAGEASPQYTQDPRGPVAERMFSVIPDAKLIYIVRDPVERLVSGYVEHATNRQTSRSLERVTSLSPISRAVWISSYATQLEQYLAHYPPDQILVVSQEAMLARRLETLREVFRFAGVDDSIVSPSFEAIRNPSAGKRRMRRIPGLPGTLRPKPTGRLPWRWRARAKRTVLFPLSVAVEKPNLADEHRQALMAHLRPEAERLRQLTGRDFAEWSV